MEVLADFPLKLALHVIVYSPALAAEICTMLVLFPSATHIREMEISGGGIHFHWKEPSLATVQERLAPDTTLSGRGGTVGSMEGGCRNVMLDVGRETNERGKLSQSKHRSAKHSAQRTHNKVSNIQQCLISSSFVTYW